MIRRLFVTLAFVLAGVYGLLWLLPSDVVTSEYASVSDARARGAWIPPEILPASSHSIRTSNNLDLNTSEGEFAFAPSDYSPFASQLRPETDAKAPFSSFDQEIRSMRQKGYEVGFYSEDRSTWVFFCKQNTGHCEYLMWHRRV